MLGTLAISASKIRVTDEPLNIIEVPLKDNIQISIDSFHHSELLEGTRAAECKICKENTETLRESWFSSLPEILFIHLKRFNVDGKTIRKNLDWVDYENEINVPLMLDPEVYGSNSMPIHTTGSHLSLRSIWQRPLHSPCQIIEAPRIGYSVMIMLSVS